MVLLSVIFCACGDKKEDTSSSSSQSSASSSSSEASGKTIKSELTAVNGKGKAASASQANSSSRSSSLAATSVAQGEPLPPTSNSAASSASLATTSAPTDDTSANSQPTQPAQQKNAVAVDVNNIDNWPSTFISVKPKGESSTQLFILKTSPDWSFDSISVYSKNKIKTCEVLSVTRNADDSTYPEMLLKKYNVEKAQPGQYGLIEKSDGVFGDNKCRTYLCLTKPVDASDEYHVYFCLINVSGFTMEMAFYTSDESGSNVVPIINNVLGSVKYIDIYHYKKSK